MENGHLLWVFPLKMVIFHSYVSLPEGNHGWKKTWKNRAPKLQWLRIFFAYDNTNLRCSGFPLPDALVELLDLIQPWNSQVAWRQKKQGGWNPWFTRESEMASWKIHHLPSGYLTYPWKMAHRNRWFTELKMMIFHGYVSHNQMV